MKCTVYHPSQFQVWFQQDISCDNQQNPVLAILNKLASAVADRPRDAVCLLKFSKSRVCDKVPEESTHIFGVTQISLKHSVGQVKGSLHAKNQPNRCSHCSRTPTCDRQTQAQPQTERHKAIAYTVLVQHHAVKKLNLVPPYT